MASVRRSARWYLQPLRAGWSADDYPPVAGAPEERLLDFFVWRRGGGWAGRLEAAASGRAGSARQARARQQAAGRADGSIQGSFWLQQFPGARMASGRDFVLVFQATVLAGCSRELVGDVFCDVRPGRSGGWVLADARLYGRAHVRGADPVEAHTLWPALALGLASHLA